MPYSKYQYVAKVADLQSISKAAAKLFISQPALTRIILNIEGPHFSIVLSFPFN